MDKRAIHLVAINIFDGKVRKEAAVIAEAFEILEECIEKIERTNAPLSWIAAQTLTEAVNTSMTLYMITLNGQYSGRKMVVISLIESLDLLIHIGSRSQYIDDYIFMKPHAENEASNWCRSKYVLNWDNVTTRAAKLSLSDDALRQLIHNHSKHWGADQCSELENLKVKMKTISRILIRLIVESANCLRIMSSREEYSFIERLNVHFEQSHDVLGGEHACNNLPAENVA